MLVSETLLALVSPYWFRSASLTRLLVALTERATASAMDAFGAVTLKWMVYSPVWSTCAYALALNVDDRSCRRTGLK